MTALDFYYSFYKFYLYTYVFIFLLTILDITDPWLIIPIYILFALYYFKVIEFNNMLMYLFVLYVLYELKFIEYIKNRIELTFIESTIVVHSVSKNILLDYVKNSNISHPYFVNLKNENISKITKTD